MSAGSRSPAHSPRVLEPAVLTVSDDGEETVDGDGLSHRSFSKRPHGSDGREEDAPRIKIETGASEDSLPKAESAGTFLEDSLLHRLVLPWQDEPRGVSVGSIVFAPQRAATHGKRVTSSPTAASPRVQPHYALAEVTGVQACAGTATVSFVWNDAGVDEEAVSLFELVPCPSSVLGRLGWEASGTHPCVSCSLLERVMGVRPSGGPLGPALARAAHRRDCAGASGSLAAAAAAPYLLCASDDECDSVPKSKENAAVTATTGERKRPRASPPKTETEEGEEEVVVRRCPGSDRTCGATGTDTEGLVFTWDPTTGSVHAFYAEAFRRLVRAVAEVGRRSLAVLSARASPQSASRAVLCVFDSYYLLRRFTVFMSLRGHAVRLLDGLDSDGGGNTEVGLLRENVVWLCVLRADAADSTVLTRLLRTAPPVEALVQFSEEEEEDQCGGGGGGGQCTPRGEAHHRVAPAVPAALSPYLSAEQVVLGRFRARPDEHDSAPSMVAGVPTPVKVKVSGGIFGTHKLLAPASKVQLLLMRTVLESAEAAHAATTRGGAGGSASRRGAVSAAAQGALSAALLERIALGNFTDTSLANLFASSGGVVATVQQHGDAAPQPFCSVAELHRLLCVDASGFGEGFPVFAAVRALVRDVFEGGPRFMRDTTTAGVPSLPRVVLVAPRGLPAGHPHSTTEQFVRSVRQYMAPWQLHELSGSLAHDAATAVQWQRHGGLLLLYCDDPSTQLGALHADADVVVACGKSAAAWVAATSGGRDGENGAPSSHSPLYFAVLSEVEVVRDLVSHEWAPYGATASHSDDDNDDDNDVVWQQLLAVLLQEAGRPQHAAVPKVLQQAVLLWGPLSAGHRGSPWRWLRREVKRIALRTAHATPVQLLELAIAS